MNDSQTPSPAIAIPSATQSNLAPAPAPSPSGERRSRLWPGILIIALQWLVVKGVGWIAPETMLHFMTRLWAPLIGSLLVAGWWLFASRIRWKYRITVFVGCAVLAIPAFLLRHPSFNGIGLLAFFLYALPALTAVCVGWLLITPWLRWPAREAGMLVLFALVWGYFTLLRFDGTDGTMSAELPYRWVPTAEENLAAYRAKTAKATPAADSAATLVLQAGDWPGFRGPNRDGRLPGVRIATDWDKNPPRLLWRHPVGPGWSSFAVVGTRLYTQEQRDEDEAIVCYECATGTELWAHQDKTRFSEAIAGPGPRATPTFHDGKIYALGASGRLNCLDAVTGKVHWSRDIVADSGRKSTGKAEDELPPWGFAASPLVVQNVVTVFAGGPNKKSVLGYDAASGRLLWTAGEGKFSYASLQPARLDGVEQIIMSSEVGLTSFNPSKGEILWEHVWPLEKGMARIVQPAIVDNAGVLLGTGFSMGTRRLGIQHQGDKWAVKEDWTTRAIKPYYNDLVVHKNHLYGFDGSVFVCVALENGKKKWGERGYGNGQVLLLADQELLLILSETGEAALVEADPAAYKELGRFQAIDGKTWNHPVIAHGMLFVRNGAEAACYLLRQTQATP